MKTKRETPLALALACLLLSGAVVLAAGINEVLDPSRPGLYWVATDPGRGGVWPPEPEAWGDEAPYPPAPPSLVQGWEDPPEVWDGPALWREADDQGLPGDGAPPWPEVVLRPTPFLGV